MLSDTDTCQRSTVWGHSPEKILGLKVLFCFGLPLFLLSAILCVRNYPITQQKQEEIRKEIDFYKKQLEV